MDKVAATSEIVIRTSRGLTIAGTRITLYTIMDYLKNEWPPHLIQDWLNLTDRQIQGALAYIEAHQAEVEAEYRQVLTDAAEARQYWDARNKARFAQIASLPPPPGKELAWAKLQEKKASLAQE
ncbi:MAG TPA: DUF433 domain-containing protein [Chloroflexi bacterium]|nr:DUF433 domain-containing protein [Chloroflexota bacterium]